MFSDCLLVRHLSQRYDIHSKDNPGQLGTSYTLGVCRNGHLILKVKRNLFPQKVGKQIELVETSLPPLPAPTPHFANSGASRSERILLNE
jgi:hypothetical protein